MKEKKRPAVENDDKARKYVLDSFAFLAHLENEERGVKVTDILKDASVITGDPEFSKMEDEVKVEWI
jgi:PIN domain nuclease of toxin-antitoxin system